MSGDKSEIDNNQPDEELGHGALQESASPEGPGLDLVENEDDEDFEEPNYHPRGQRVESSNTPAKREEAPVSYAATASAKPDNDDDFLDEDYDSQDYEAQVQAATVLSAAKRLDQSAETPEQRLNWRQRRRAKKASKAKAKAEKNTRNKQLTQKRFQLSVLIQRAIRTIGFLMFAATTVIVLFVLGRPWIDPSLYNRAEDITLPSLQNLQAMSRAERLRLRDKALLAAADRAQNVVGDPLPPAIGGDLVELGTYRLRSIESTIDVEGVARYFSLPDGRRFLRLSGFELTGGYDLRLLLTLSTEPASRADLEEAGFVDLAPLKGENGDQNYLLPDSFFLEDFDSIVIYDQLFEVVYAYALLAR